MLWTISTVATVIGALVTVVVLEPAQLLAFVLLAAAIPAWAAVFLRPAWRPRKHVLACALTVALSALALTPIYYRGHLARATQPPPALDGLTHI